MSEKLEKYIHDCMTKEKIDMYSFFSERQLLLLEKIDLKIENKKYTINEFDKKESALLELYNVDSLRAEKGITKEQCSELLDVFDKISKEYKI